MNLPIKFRAWDNQSKKWLLGYKYPNLGGFSLTGECVLFGEWGNVFDTFLFNKDGKKWDDLKITQFIGLSDKNKKEIYAGDILKYDSGLGRIRFHKVWNAEGGFVINTHQDDFYKEDDNICFWEGCSDMQTIGYVKQMEIIGNIFENPELLIKQ